MADKSRNSTPTGAGRGAPIRPANRFERVHLEADWEQLEIGDEETLSDRPATQFAPDRSRTILRENDSPDLAFRYSLNPYRGCEHGCAYCYARPTHETLGLDAGLDFESRILVKYDAAALLRTELNRPGWRGEEYISLSGVTDCYQPIERKLRITRSCLEVLLEARQACGIVTKNALVTHDLDLLAPLAKRRLVHVYLSLTSLDAELCRRLEPRTSSPAAKLAAIARLRAAGVPVGVMVAPVIPGLTDSGIAETLRQAADAGAQSATYTMLRLPLAVAPIFEAWLDHQAQAPDAKEKVLGRVRAMRGGSLNSSEFGQRMRGQGVYAEQIKQSFLVFRKQFGLEASLPLLDCSCFRRPRRPGDRQRRMFD